MATTNLTNSVKTPGVYIEEIRKFPPSIAQVETAIPAFIGYTQTTVWRGRSLLLEPTEIRSLLEYELYFGKALPETAIRVTINRTATNTEVTASIDRAQRSKFLMYYAMQLFFANGGGRCFIISTGDYASSGGQILRPALQQGLAASEKINDITLYVFPDAQGLDNPADYYGLYSDAIRLCNKLKDRFTVTDVWRSPEDEAGKFTTSIKLLRDNLPPETEFAKYGASYFPNLETTLDFEYGPDETVAVNFNGEDINLLELKNRDNALYFRARSAILNLDCNMPPSPAVVGIYARVDAARGVWKAPANVSVNAVNRPELLLTDEDQGDLNVDALAGKSVNVIRSFPGRGNLVWGARTLAGNDNEWRYIPVRRFFNMVEESTKNATAAFVFEPNDRNTWTRVRSMIENFLTLQWRAGALMGATTEQAYYVRVGLNETMTEFDILAGLMIVEIGMAVVRPAEFIILQFSHKMLSES